MRIKIINTGKIREVNASYGLRLIEQGKAKAAPKTAEVNLPSSAKAANSVPEGQTLSEDKVSLPASKETAKAAGDA